MKKYTIESTKLGWRIRDTALDRLTLHPPMPMPMAYGLARRMNEQEDKRNRPKRTRFKA